MKDSSRGTCGKVRKYCDNKYDKYTQTYDDDIRDPVLDHAVKKDGYCGAILLVSLMQDEIHVSVELK